MDDRGTTPERVEFENSVDFASEEELLSEMDEDEWTDRNFGASKVESKALDVLAVRNSLFHTFCLKQRTHWKVVCGKSFQTNRVVSNINYDWTHQLCSLHNKIV